MGSRTRNERNSQSKAVHTKPTETITTQSRSNGEEDPKPKRKSAKSFAARKKNRKFENLDFDQDDERKTKTNLTTKADPQRTNAGKLQPKWKGEPQLANVEKFENHFETSTRIGTGILPISKTDAHRTKTMTREHANGVINSRRVGIADWIEHALARKEDVLNLKKMENLGIFNFNRNANKRPAPKLSHHTPQERTHGLRTDYGVEGRKGGKERKSSEKNLKSKNSGNLGILNFHRDAKKQPAHKPNHHTHQRRTHGRRTDDGEEGWKEEKERIRDDNCGSTNPNNQLQTYTSSMAPPAPTIPPWPEPLKNYSHINSNQNTNIESSKNLIHYTTPTTERQTPMINWRDEEFTATPSGPRRSTSFNQEIGNKGPSETCLQGRILLYNQNIQGIIESDKLKILV